MRQDDKHLLSYPSPSAAVAAAASQYACVRVGRVMSDMLPRRGKDQRCDTNTTASTSSSAAWRPHLFCCFDSRTTTIPSLSWSIFPISILISVALFVSPPFLPPPLCLGACLGRVSWPDG